MMFMVRIYGLGSLMSQSDYIVCTLLLLSLQTMLNRVSLVKFIPILERVEHVIVSCLQAFISIGRGT